MMDTINLSNIWTVKAMKNAVKNAGSHFFDPASMRFFNSKVYDGIRHTEKGITFITSEQFDSNSPRLYTVRILRENAEIDDVSKFQEFATLAQARQAEKGVI